VSSASTEAERLSRLAGSEQDVSARGRYSGSQSMTDDGNSGESNKLPAGGPLFSDAPASALKKKGAAGRRVRFSLSEPTADGNNCCRSICCRLISSDRVRHPTACDGLPMSPRHAAPYRPAEICAPTKDDREPAVSGDQQGEADSESASDGGDECLPPTKRRRVTRQTPAVAMSPTEKSKKRCSSDGTVGGGGTVLQPHGGAGPRSILDIMDVQRERQVSIAANAR
jgi:hypothetical protein